MHSINFNNVKRVDLAALVAFAGLILGIVYYSECRWQSIELFLFIHGNYCTAFSLNSFPSFIHVFSLSLFSWYVGVFKSAYSNAILWLVLNAAFEFGQLTTNPPTFLLNAIGNYFAVGSFDIYDIALSFFGAITFIAFIQFISGKDYVFKQ